MHEFNSSLNVKNISHKQCLKPHKKMNKVRKPAPFLLEFCLLFSQAWRRTPVIPAL